MIEGNFEKMKTGGKNAKKQFFLDVNSSKHLNEISYYHCMLNHMLNKP